MNQKLAIGLFCSGLSTFLMSLAEFFSRHQSWHDMSSPSEVAHIMVITASFLMTIGGAMGIQLPRNKNSRIEDKVPAENIVVTQIKEKDPHAKD